jgi:hypothetical protein
MKKAALIIAVFALAILSARALAVEDLTACSCQELVQMAQTYQQDLKTVDAALGSALDDGRIDRIRNYKLKKGAVKAQLESVMRVLEFKGCVRN